MRDKDFASMGWTLHCCSEAMSSVVKTVKDHAATKTSPQWTANIKFKAQTQPALLLKKRAPYFFFSSEKSCFPFYTLNKLTFKALLMACL
jgi:hypothetical protein